MLLVLKGLSFRARICLISSLAANQLPITVTFPARRGRLQRPTSSGQQPLASDAGVYPLKWGRCESDYSLPCVREGRHGQVCNPTCPIRYHALIAPLKQEKEKAKETRIVTGSTRNGAGAQSSCHHLGAYELIVRRLRSAPHQCSSWSRGAVRRF